MDDGREPVPHGLHTGSEQGEMACEEEVWARRQAAGAPGFVSPKFDIKFRERGIEIEEETSCGASLRANHQEPN